MRHMQRPLGKWPLDLGERQQRANFAMPILRRENQIPTVLWPRHGVLGKLNSAADSEKSMKTRHCGH